MGMCSICYSPSINPAVGAAIDQVGVTKNTFEKRTISSFSSLISGFVWSEVSGLEPNIIDVVKPDIVWLILVLRRIIPISFYFYIL